MEHCSSLTTAHSTHFLCGANGAGAHAHAQPICACINEALCLGRCHNVTTDDLEVRVGLLQVPQHVQLEGAITLAAVQHHCIHAHLHQASHALLISLSGAHGSTTAQAALLVHSGSTHGRECAGLLVELTGCDAHKSSTGVGDHDGVLLLGLDQVICSLACGALWQDCHILGHDIPQGFEVVRLKVHFLGGHQPQELPVYLSGVGDDDAGEGVGIPEQVHLHDGGGGWHHNGLDVEAWTMTLDPQHMLSLLLDGVVVVHEAHASHQRHGDGHP
mmetsp:Transcript_27327/g.73892  ORF Transcript_27327/g.73892 Transcript_27327/m.73892 type:complete len:273 (-) Transcript_27327:318-1136(-)